MRTGDFIIRINGTVFRIPRPTPRLRAWFPPQIEFGPSIKPYHIEADLEALGFVRKRDKLHGVIYVHKSEVNPVPTDNQATKETS